jgi:SAM-dependent methyltransferase
VRWLDVCCGTGRAAAEASALLARGGLADRVEIVGLDLVDHFTVPARPPGFRLVTASVNDWEPDARFDLITCVHGLHYVGDKLGALARIASWLTGDGLFVANLDARSIRFVDATGARAAAELRRAGFMYDTRRRRVSRRGLASVRFRAGYLGADDRAGPNYTGQPAVDSFYRPPELTQLLTQRHRDAFCRNDTHHGTLSPEEQADVIFGFPESYLPVVASWEAGGRSDRGVADSSA